MLENYKCVGDFHTHTLVSQHAYSTINEMIEFAKLKNFSYLAMTDHAPEILDGAIAHHFLCLDNLPDKIGDFSLIKGVELNIKDFEGRVDLPENILYKLGFNIASYHIDAIVPSNKSQHTEGWLKIINNPYIDCLGHCGDPTYDFDHKEIVLACRNNKKAIELNSNSISFRKGSEKNIKDVLRLCEKYGVEIFVNSDAHCCYKVGEFTEAKRVLLDINFPPELIVNTSEKHVEEFLNRRKKEKYLQYKKKN